MRRVIDLDNHLDEDEQEETHHFNCPLPSSVQPIFFADPQLDFMLNVMLGLQLAVQVQSINSFYVMLSVMVQVWLL
jgi:hypothetical protein